MTLVLQQYHSESRLWPQISIPKGDGFHHVHFHVVARLPTWPDTLKGPRIFSGLGDHATAVPAEVTTPLALAVREYLLREQSGLEKGD